MKTIKRAFFTLLFLSAGSVFGADTVAFLSNMKGDVAVDAESRPTLLAELSKGQKIVVGKDAQAAVMFIASGKEFVLKGPGEYLVNDLEVVSTSGQPPAIRSTEWRASGKVLTQVAQTSSASVRMRSIAPPKSDTGPKLLYPTTGNITTLQPTFRWRAADPKTQADFVLRIAGQDKPVAQAKAAGGAFKVPAKLKPGAEYTWTVAMNGDEIGSGGFRTLSAEAIQQIDKRRPSDKAEFSDRLMFTLMLQEVGAVQEAQESWAKLSQERSDLPELAAFAK